MNNGGKYSADAELVISNLQTMIGNLARENAVLKAAFQSQALSTDDGGNENGPNPRK